MSCILISFVLALNGKTDTVIQIGIRSKVRSGSGKLTNQTP